MEPPIAPESLYDTPSLTTLDIILIWRPTHTVQQSELVYVRNQAIAHAHQALGSHTFFRLVKRNIWWRDDYAYYQLGFKPDNMEIRDGVIFIYYTPNHAPFTTASLPNSHSIANPPTSTE